MDCRVIEGFFCAEFAAVTEGDGRLLNAVGACEGNRTRLKPAGERVLETTKDSMRRTVKASFGLRRAEVASCARWGSGLRPTRVQGSDERAGGRQALEGAAKGQICRK